MNWTRMRIRLRYGLIICLSTSVFFLIPDRLLSASQHPYVIILDSYHQGEAWSDNEIAGILPVLQARYPTLVPSIEHLDAKRYTTKEHLMFMKDHLVHKYKGLEVDLIMVLDNPALTMIVQYGSELFPGVPVVFAGINGFQQEMIAGRDRVTGVSERQDVEGTLRMAIKLFPAAKKVLAVHDYTSSGRAVRREAEEAFKKFSGSFEISYPSDASFDELERQLQAMPQDGLVLLLTYVTDRSGRTFTRSESTRLISSLSRAPVFAMHETRLGYGIIGGMLLEGHEHGKQAAEIAVRILSGEDPASIPVEDSRSRPVLDYQVLSRFDVTERLWPKDVTFINRPVSVWTRHRSVLIPSIIVITLLASASLLMGILMTRMRRAEAALRESEWKFMALFENSPLAIAFHRMIYDRDERPKDYYFIDANENFKKMTGVDPKEKTVTEAFPGINKDQTDWIDLYGDIVRTGRTLHMEKYFQLNDQWYDIVGFRYAPDHFAVAFLNITESKRAEEALIESERRFRETLENANLIALQLDSDGNITFANNFLAKITGWELKEIVGKNWFDLFVPEELRNGIRQLHAANIRKGEIVKQYENDIITRTGERRLIAWTNSHMFDMKGGISGITALGIDLTEHKKLENQYIQSQKMEAVGLLAGGIAHDFNNILTAIIGYGNLLNLKLESDSPLRPFVSSILNSADKAAGLTRQILAFSRKQIISPKETDLNALIMSIEKMLSRLIGEDIEFSTNLTEQDVMVMVDPGQIEQVLMNLCTNARDAMPAGGSISIGTDVVELDTDTVKEYGLGEPGRYVLVSVVDTGTGMDEKTKGQMFEPFFTSKGVGKGTGLGLSIVYGIIRQHNGSVIAHSEPGKGTTFRIYLPCVGTTVRRTAFAEDIRLPRGNETILLAEDNHEVRQYTALLLEEFGYTVITAPDGEEAVKRFAEHKDDIDMVILDVIMPKKSGREVRDEIMKMRPDCKVLFTSGYTADVITTRGIWEEGMQFVPKPVKPNDLLVRIREILNTRS